MSFIHLSLSTSVSSMHQCRPNNCNSTIKFLGLEYKTFNSDTISEVIVHQLSQKLKLLGERPILLLYIYQLQLEVNILSTKFFFLISP